MAYYGYRRKPNAAKQSNKPIIFFDQGRGAFVVKAPYSTDLKNNLCTVCPSAIYLGKTEQAFQISAEEVENAKVVLEALFNEYDFIDKPSENGFKPFSSGSDAANAALTMFQIGGYEGARKVYSILMMKYHPDRNPDPEAKIKAQEITLAWRKLKTELGWS